ncbi:MAG: 4Fe-4S dicluster domain-containing protein [Desulfurococcaceae archaeon]
MDQDNPNPVDKILYLRIIDLNKCIGCGSCEAVCDFIHEGTPFIKLYRTDIGLDIPVSCLHCRKAPCIDVCPTGAMTRDKQGAVYVVESKCIGCMACLYACPFGIPELDKRTGVSIKCDLCRVLRNEGLEPACSAICPTNAIVYGLDKTVFDIVKKRVAEVFAKTKYETITKS